MKQGCVRLHIKHDKPLIFTSIFVLVGSATNSCDKRDNVYKVWVFIVEYTYLTTGTILSRKTNDVEKYYSRNNYLNNS